MTDRTRRIHIQETLPTAASPSKKLPELRRPDIYEQSNFLYATHYDPGLLFRHMKVINFLLDYHANAKMSPQYLAILDTTDADPPEFIGDLGIQIWKDP